MDITSNNATILIVLARSDGQRIKQYITLIV